MSDTPEPVPRTPAADEACEHCDDGIVWEDGVVGSCCEVCGGVGVVLSPDNGDACQRARRSEDGDTQ